MGGRGVACFLSVFGEFLFVSFLNFDKEYNGRFLPFDSGRFNYRPVSFGQLTQKVSSFSFYELLTVLSAVHSFIKIIFVWIKPLCLQL